MRLAVQIYLPRRQALLFLIAILVPCGVLVALALRIVEQDRQLESKRLVDERQRVIEQVRQELLSELEKIKLQQVTRAVTQDDRPDGTVAFVGRLMNGQLQLPWENSSKARRFQEFSRRFAFIAALCSWSSFDLVSARSPRPYTPFSRSALSRL